MYSCTVSSDSQPQRLICSNDNRVFHTVVPSIIGAEFAAATVLISFGAVLGKVSATQLLLMAVIEVVLFQVNQLIVFSKLKVYIAYALNIEHVTCNDLAFYRAMHFSAYARSWDRMSSVCPSVRL